MANEDGFLSRWSRRKVQVQQGLPVPPAPVAEVPAPAALALVETSAPPTVAAAAAQVPAQAAADAEAPPAPTLQEALQLTPSDDFSRFVGRGVDPQVKNAALKNLFSDPHFNVMDGLDTYIDDYNTPDPLPEGMLRKMVQSTMLGLFDDEPDRADAAAPPGQATPTTPTASPAGLAPTPPTEPLPPHEDPAVRLQPNDDAGPAGDQPGPVEDPGRQQ